MDPAYDPLIQLSPLDNVAVARIPIRAGVRLTAGGRLLTVHQLIPAGHKLALQPILAGQPILRYGTAIGFASQSILAGDWVHTHNVTLPVTSRSLDFTLWQGEPAAARHPGLTFQGYARPDGQAGTRNFIAVVATVSCAAQTALAVANHFTSQRLEAYPNVDGVIAVTHHSGCSMPPDGLAFTYLQRCLANLARHPNLAGLVYISLGCEVMQMADCLQQGGNPPGELERGFNQTAPLLNIQQLGGIEKTRREGIRQVEAILEQANRVHRSPQPLGKLKIALQCGGSDGWSGVTANPLVGRVVDEITAQGGTAVLAETPEIYGAEQLLLGRVVSETAARRLMRQLRWWEEQAALLGFSLDNNPTPGNKAGGLTTIYEKSLGAVAKGGSSPLAEVIDYAEIAAGPGLVFMDSPGNDPVSVTGQLAAGCNLVMFTTGRGSVFSSSLAPTLKIASNSALFDHLREDMDFNAGALLDGMPGDQARDDLLGLVIETASGQPASGERNRLRQVDFVPWQPGPVL